MSPGVSGMAFEGRTPLECAFCGPTGLLKDPVFLAVLFSLVPTQVSHGAGMLSTTPGTMLMTRTGTPG